MNSKTKRKMQRILPTSRGLHLELIGVVSLPEDSGTCVMGLCTALSRTDYQVDGIGLVQVELTALLLSPVHTHKRMYVVHKRTLQQGRV